MYLSDSQLRSLTSEISLPQNLAPGYNHPEGRRFFFLKKLLVRRQLVLRVVNAAIDILNRNFSAFAKDRETLKKSVERLSDESFNEELASHLFGSNFGYQDEDKDVNVWLHYRRFLKQKPNFGESPFVYEESINRCTEFLSAGAAGVLNFGVCYAHLDSSLAKTFSGKKFFGIERSTLVQVLNRHEFNGISNLEFASEDIFDFLETSEVKNFVLLHTRILTFLPPEFVKSLFEKSREAGICKIVGVEPYGISRTSGKAPELSYGPRPSEAFRAGMYLHNYPNFLDSAGFKCTSATMLKTTHDHPDYRLFCYSAQLV